MFASTAAQEVKGVRKGIFLTIYSNGMATVSEEIGVRLPERSAVPKDSFQPTSTTERGGLMGIFGGGRTTSGLASKSTEGIKRQEEPSAIVVRVEELSNYIDEDSLFTSAAFVRENLRRSSAGTYFSVRSTELKNSDGQSSVREILEESVGKYVRLIDSDSDSDNLTTFEGVLENIQGALVVLGPRSSDSQNVGSAIQAADRSQKLTSSKTILELPRRAALQFPENDEVLWNALKPYLMVNAIYKKGSLAPGKELVIPLTYETNGVSFEMSYMFIVAVDEKNMSVSLKAHIENGTTSDFNNVDITVVEVADSEKEQPRKRYVRRANKATLYASARGSNTYNDDENQIQAVSLEQDKSRSQKEVHINNLGLPMSLKSKSSSDFITHQSSDSEVQMDYVFRPQIDANIVRMELVFDNTKDNGIGFSLPRGEATVMQERTSGGLTKLGDTIITKRHDKKRVRIKLGIANTITARLETLGTRVDTSANTSITDYRVTVKNTKTQNVRVTLKYVFSEKSWKTVEGGDVTFEVDIPDDPKTESYSQSEARGFISAPAQAESKYLYSIAIPL